MSLNDLIDREMRDDDPEARAVLMADLAGWRDGLVAAIQRVEQQFSDRSADARAYQEACRSRGAEGKRDWLAYEADHLAWRRGANGYKRHLTERLRRVNAMLREHNREQYDRRGRAMRDVRAVVDAWWCSDIETGDAMRRITTALDEAGL